MKASRRAVLAAIGSATVAGNVGSTSRPLERQTRDEVSLLLNWKPNGLHVPYYTADARGYYESEGLDVDITSGQGSDFAAKQVGIGNTDLAITSADQIININSRNLSPTCVGVMMQKSPVVVFTVGENFGEELTDAEQLKGKTIGSGPGMVRILTKLLLKRKGVSDTVEVVDTGYDTVQRLLNGEIDAAGGVFGDAIAARHQGYSTSSIRVANTIPSYGHVIAANSSVTDERPDSATAFLRATAHGAAWAAQNPTQATDHFIERNQAAEGSRAIVRETWEQMANGFMLSDAVRRNGWGWSEPNPWRVMYRALRNGGLLGGEVDPESVWTNGYIDTDEKYIESYADIVSDAGTRTRTS